MYICGAAANASKWQMGFNSALKGLIQAIFNNPSVISITNICE
jgi:hypothetical protein